MYSWSAFGSGTDKATVTAQVDAQLAPIELNWSRDKLAAAADVTAARALIARQIAELEIPTVPEGEPLKVIKVEAYGHHTPGVSVLTHVGVWIAEPEPTVGPVNPATKQVGPTN